MFISVAAVVALFDIMPLEGVPRPKYEYDDGFIRYDELSILLNDYFPDVLNTIGQLNLCQQSSKTISMQGRSEVLLDRRDDQRGGGVVTNSR